MRRASKQWSFTTIVVKYVLNRWGLGCIHKMNAEQQQETAQELQWQAFEATKERISSARDWIPQAQYYRENPEYQEKRKQQWRNQYARNRVALLTRAKDRVTCVCGVEHARASKSQHLKSTAHQTHLAIKEHPMIPLDIVQPLRGKRIECPCGGHYHEKDKAGHEATKGHTRYTADGTPRLSPEERKAKRNEIKRELIECQVCKKNFSRSNMSAHIKTYHTAGAHEG